jgi:hypothetical protein
MKVLSQNNGSPTNITIVNNRFTKTHFGGGEDLLQLENHGAVLVDHNTFSSNPSGEDGLDIKTGGGVTIRANLFEGVNINAECLMVAGNAQSILVQGNKMVDCTTSLGAGYDQMPTWTFRGNLLINTRMQLRRSANAIIDNNTMQGGHVQMGTPAAGDVPKNVVFTNQHYSGTTFHAWPGATWTPSSYGAV